MTITLSREARQEAQTSLDRYFAENFDGEIGNLASGLLLDFILEEIGPSIYNRAVADFEERVRERLGEIGSEVFAEEFSYWRRRDRRAKR